MKPCPQHARTNPRLDLYTGVHKGLRRCMVETLVRLGSFDAADPAERQATLAAVRDSLELLHAHAGHENVHLHPAIESSEPGASARAAADHERHGHTIEALLAATRLAEHADQAERPALVERLYRHYALFLAANLQHMHVEETAHNEVLWSTRSDAELAAIEARLVGDIAPAQLNGYLRWMVRAFNPDEMLALYAGMQAQMPADAFSAVLEIAREELPRAAWTRLARGLGLQVAA